MILREMHHKHFITLNPTRSQLICKTSKYMIKTRHITHFLTLNTLNAKTCNWLKIFQDHQNINYVQLGFRNQRMQDNPCSLNRWALETLKILAHYHPIVQGSCTSLCNRQKNIKKIKHKWYRFILSILLGPLVVARILSCSHMI